MATARAVGRSGRTSGSGIRDKRNARLQKEKDDRFDRSNERAQRNQDRRDKKEEKEKRKRDRHAKQRAKGEDFQKKSRERADDRLKNEGDKLKARKSRLDKMTDGGPKGKTANEIEKAQGDTNRALERNRIKAKKHLDKGKSLFERRGSGADLENQKELRKAAMSIAGDAKSAGKLLDRRAKGGADYKDADKTRFDNAYKNELKKSGRGEEEIADIGTRTPKLAREQSEIDRGKKNLELSRETETKGLEKKLKTASIDEEEVDVIKANLTDQDDQKNSLAKSMRDENFGILTEKMQDGVLDEKDIGDFNSVGDYDVEVLSTNEDGVPTIRLTHKKGEAEPREVELTPTLLKASHEAMKEVDTEGKATALREKKIKTALNLSKVKATTAKEAAKLTASAKVAKDIASNIRASDKELSDSVKSTTKTVDTLQDEIATIKEKSLSLPTGSEDGAEKSAGLLEQYKAQIVAKQASLDEAKEAQAVVKKRQGDRKDDKELEQLKNAKRLKQANTSK